MVHFVILAIANLRYGYRPENLISMQVFAPNCVVVPTRLKIDYTPISNKLWLDSKQEFVHMYNT
jgi:hypothetical protein